MASLNRAYLVSSLITPIASVASIDANHGLKPDVSNFTVSIRYYSDDQGTPAIPGAGTVTISATSLLSNQNTTIVGGELVAADYTSYVEWDHNCTKVTATPLGVTTATHYQILVIQET